MNGYATIEIPVDITSLSAQSVPAGTFKKVKYALENRIPLEIKGMKSSTTDIGAVRCEGLYESSSDIVGSIPAEGKTATFKSTEKVTFSS